MNSRSKKLLSAFRKEALSSPPFWFMRQAGRYLPEYRELRKNAKHFLDFCYTPSMACEATVQPIKRFAMDGAIIFSDILVIPDALGVSTRFEEKKGPVLEPVQTDEALNKLTLNTKVLLPVYEALKQTRATLPDETTLIGFAGAPWTLACYITQGQSSRDFQEARSISISKPEFFSRLIDMLTDAVSQHCIAQIKAGAEIIQIFDSWAGVLSEAQFHRWSIEPAKKIVKAIKDQYPDVPVIGFPRQAGVKTLEYVKKTGVDGINIDSSVTLQWAHEQLQSLCVVQGNLDPLVLAENKNEMLAQAKDILVTLAKKNFVFNLGHGILPHTPIENVHALCDLIRNYTQRP